MEIPTYYTSSVHNNNNWLTLRMRYISYIYIDRPAVGMRADNGHTVCSFRVHQLWRFKDLSLRRHDIACVTQNVYYTIGECRLFVWESRVIGMEFPRNDLFIAKASGGECGVVVVGQCNGQADWFMLCIQIQMIYTYTQLPIELAPACVNRPRYIWTIRWGSCTLRLPNKHNNCIAVIATDRTQSDKRTICAVQLIDTDLENHLADGTAVKHASFVATTQMHNGITSTAKSARDKK